MTHSGTGRLVERLLSPSAHHAKAVFIVTCAVALLFALYTNHAWEDYYITYRTSKNLATGQGLVFTPGERVHVFTSPLNVLLPAACSMMLGNRSDDGALWMYRLVSIGALGAAAYLLVQTMKSLQWRPAAMFLAVGLLVLDPKVVDFTINGQEIGFMMFFLAATMHALFGGFERWRAVRLGLAWAGLMWTRPDGMVYGGLLALGCLAFAACPGYSRREAFKLCLGAGAVAALAYLPWLVFAASYYGSPVPHTIVAKGLSRSYDAFALLASIVSFLLQLAAGTGHVQQAFMPVYAGLGGWPMSVYIIAGALTWISAWYWLFPGADPTTRAVSLAFLGGSAYLTLIAATPEPWYLPSVLIAGCWVVGGGCQHLLKALTNPSQQPAAPVKVAERRFAAVAGLLLTYTAVMLLATAVQMDARQQIIEDGNRRLLGLWLKDHAKTPQDTVFIECLGYVGYFSGLKMYDFPGLSSPEVVEVRRRIPSAGWAQIIRELRPDWVVLRPAEIENVRRYDPHLLEAAYRPVQTFDVTSRISAFAKLVGRDYTMFDRTFVVFARTPQDAQERPPAPRP